MGFTNEEMLVMEYKEATKVASIFAYTQDSRRYLDNFGI